MTLPQRNPHHPTNGAARGDPTRKLAEPIKALAFNTLLSSQETDTHRAEPRFRRPRLRGNPLNLPGASLLSSGSRKIFSTSRRCARPPRDDTAPGRRPGKDRFVGGALRAGHLAASCIPSGLVLQEYPGPQLAANHFLCRCPPGPSACRRPASPWGTTEIRQPRKARQIGFGPPARQSRETRRSCAVQIGGVSPPSVPRQRRPTGVRVPSAPSPTVVTVTANGSGKASRWTK